MGDDDESLAFINLQELKDQLEDDTAVDELFDLLGMMQEELQASIRDHADSLAGGGAGELANLRMELETFREKNSELEIEIDALKSDGSGHKQRLEELEDQNRRHVEELNIKTRENSDLKFQLTGQPSTMNMSNIVKTHF